MSAAVALSAAQVAFHSAFSKIARAKCREPHIQQIVDRACLIDLLTRRTPGKPYCSDDLTRTTIRPRGLALKRPYVQLNPSWIKSFLVVDIDREGMMLEPGTSPVSFASTAWLDAGLPAPTWIALTPANGHAHCVWALKSGVNAENPPELRYFKAVERGLCRALTGDPGYAGLLTKNPLHPSWRVLQPAGGTPLYELGDLAECVDLSAPGRGVDQITPRRGGVGARNVTLFDSLRHWSYRNVHSYRYRAENAGRGAGEVSFTAACFDVGRTMNKFDPPLSNSELWQVAKSIGHWTYHRYSGRGGGGGDTDEELSLAQSERGKRSALVRGQTSKEKATEARKMRKKGMTQTAIAEALGLSERRVRDLLKKPSKMRTQKPRKAA